MNRWFSLISFATALLSLAAGASQGVVTLVEAGHSLSQIVDSAVPLHPSQAALDSVCAFGNVGNVESIRGPEFKSHVAAHGEQGAASARICLVGSCRLDAVVQ